VTALLVPASPGPAASDAPMVHRHVAGRWDRLLMPSRLIVQIIRGRRPSPVWLPALRASRHG